MTDKLEKEKQKKEKKDLVKFKEFDPSEYVNTEPTIKEAKNSTVVFSFGRMNPPTIGHEKLVNKVKDVARSNGADARIYLSHTQNNKKDPLNYRDKFTFARKAFGDIVTQSKSRQVFQIAAELEKSGYTSLIMVVGSDRVQEFKSLLNKYNGKDYNFDSIEVVSAGERDPDAQGVEGMSGTKLRAIAKAGDFETFKQAAASKLSDSDKMKMMKLVQKNLVEELREALTMQQRRKRSMMMRRIKSKIKRGRERSMKKRASMDTLRKRAQISARKALKNKMSQGRYADLSYSQRQKIDDKIKKMGDTRIKNLARKMLPSVKKREIERKKKKQEGVAQDKQVKDLPGTQPKKYYSGIDTKKDKESRAKHFARKSKMSDDDPRAYTPAPGDKDAKTKPSKYTKKYDQMFGEAFEELEENKKALQNKADETGISYSILKKVFDRGVAAWRTGHRPGTTPSQWGLARVNSFATGGKTRTTADKDLWDEHKGKKESEIHESVPRWLKNIIGTKANPKQYQSAQKILQDIIDRKKREAGRKGLQHDIPYYAFQVAKQFAGVDARILAKTVSEDEEDPCWDGYKQVGMKKKNGKMVPNCVQEARAKQAVAGNKVQKLVTGFDMTYKGKKYDEIDLELMGIDNSTQVVTFRILHPKEHIGDEVKIPFKTLRRGRFMATDTSKINEDVTQKQINDLEKFADRILAKFDIDVEFTRHFVDRMNDTRNDPEIKIAELQKLFKKIQKNKGKDIAGNAGLEAVLKDLSSDLNLPVVIKQKGDEIELVSKTIMRKPNFKTTSKIIKYEEFSKMNEASRADMKVRKRPHMMLKANNQGVKFDGRFKMYKKKNVLKDEEKPLQESSYDLKFSVLELQEATNAAQQAAIAISKKERGEYKENELEEGINDPGIFKAVFLAGGPGSGKSFMVGKTALTTLGLKLINSDPAFEQQLSKVGLKPTPEDIFSPEGQSARDKAKKLTVKRQKLALEGRLGLVIDGTGKDYDKIAKQANDLKKLGYEVAMIFVNTNLETAINRDAKRDRTLGAKEVTKMWNQVQDNIGKFQSLFGSNMIIVDNSDGANWQKGSLDAYKKMSKWIAKEPKSPMAKKWIASVKAQRGITEDQMQEMMSKSGAGEEGTTELVKKLKKDTPNEKV